MTSPPLKTEQMTEAEFKRQNKRGFLAFIGLSLAAGFGLRAIFNAELDREVPWPLRRANEIGDSFWKSLKNDALAPERNEKALGRPRLNGDIGIDASIDPLAWRMKVSAPSLEGDLLISLSDLAKLPQTTETIEFKCIEGWSEWMTFTGVRFTDFMKAYGLDAERSPYVGLTSVDSEYYVAMDLQSMLHPQTLLCLEMNGKTLTAEHGMPVRLVTSVKYGVKSIKQIGQIKFTEAIPPDYWAENGYGEYLGL